jgi:dihydropyrimidinase
VPANPAADRPVPAFPGADRPILIKGAHCVVPLKGVFPLDVRIEKGKIHSLGRDLDGAGCQVIGAEGKYLLPGVVDPHTHLGIFAPFETEALTETRSALLGGVTTMGVYLGGQEPYLKILDRVIGTLAGRSYTDVFLHLAIFTRAQLEEIPLYASRYGIRSFKAYMSGIPGLIPSLDEGFLLDLMEAVAALGPQAVLNVHAENHHIVEWATGRVRAAKPDGLTLPEWTATHPDFSEAEAVQRAAYLAARTGVRVYFVHVSSAETLQVIRRLKAEGRRFFVETTSPYLTLTDQTPQGALAKMVPPVRTEEDRLALWEGLKEDLIDSIGTDHTPMTLEEKRPDASLWDAMPGYPAVGTHLASLADGARRQRFPLLRLAEKIALNPARIFGLYPRKGTLLPGGDADLVILDPHRSMRVTPEAAASRADFALHEGETLIGGPVAVIQGGRPVLPEEVRAGRQPPSGVYLKR